ncbi:hypothetical protein L9F63_014292, partial [Diploptera punctata]
SERPVRAPFHLYWSSRILSSSLFFKLHGATNLEGPWPIIRLQASHPQNQFPYVIVEKEMQVNLALADVALPAHSSFSNHPRNFFT